MRLEDEVILYKSMVGLYKYDFLTGLKQRYDFMEETKHKMTSQQFYLMMTDVTGLHSVNRESGFEAGDKLIQQVARDLEDIRYEWETYRVGGDEFMTILFSRHTDCVANATSACVFSGDYNKLEDMIKDVDKLVTDKKVKLNRRRT